MLTQRIFDWADRAADKPAIIAADRVWTYADLAEAIGQARGYFIGRGVFGGGVVSLAVEDQIQVWILTLALRSLGVTTMARGFDVNDAPLLRCAVKRAGEDIPQLEALCAASGVPLLDVAFESELPVGLGEGPEIESPGGHILHTSGTTGVHKKVLVDPVREQQVIEQHRQALGLHERMIYSTFTCPVSTGAGYQGGGSVLGCGATLVIDFRSAHAPLLQPGLTHAHLTPMILRSILAAPADSFAYNPQLRLMCGGGTMSWAEVEEAKRRITPNIFNFMGSTEAGIMTLTPVDTPDGLRWHKIADGVEMQVVDDRDQPLSAGQVGRVRVKSLGAATSYLDDEAATAAFFRDGYFYPGDLALWREDGRLGLQGRVTEIINLDGVKISPAPIEERLRDALRFQVVLLTIQDDFGEEGLHMVIEAPTLPPTEVLSKALWAEFN